MARDDGSGSKSFYVYSWRKKMTEWSMWDGNDEIHASPVHFSFIKTQIDI